MPIIKKTVWMAKCDDCKKDFGENSLFGFAETKKQLLEGLDSECWEVKGKKVLCDECSFEGENEEEEEGE